MKSCLSELLLMLLLFISIRSYSLPGDWKLKNIDGQPADKDIVVRITQTITDYGQIRHILNFSNCQNITYQVYVEQNFMSIDSALLSQAENNTKNSEVQCTQSESKLQKHISQTLKKVFFFSIKQDLLVFVSPNGNDLFEFSRIKKIYLTNLTGTWLLDEIYWERASNTQVIVTSENFTFCEGKLIASYKTNSIDQIEFDIKESKDCKEANLTKALNNIAYYRLKDTELELYDTNSVEVMQLFFKNGNWLKEEEKVVTESPLKPVGGSVTIVESKKLVKTDQPTQNNLRSMKDNTANSA